MSLNEKGNTLFNGKVLSYFSHFRALIPFCPYFFGQISFGPYCLLLSIITKNDLKSKIMSINKASDELASKAGKNPEGTCAPIRHGG